MNSDTKTSFTKRSPTITKLKCSSRLHSGATRTARNPSGDHMAAMGDNLTLAVTQTLTLSLRPTCSSAGHFLYSGIPRRDSEQARFDDVRLRKDRTKSKAFRQIRTSHLQAGGQRSPQQASTVRKQRNCTYVIFFYSIVHMYTRPSRGRGTRSRGLRGSLASQRGPAYHDSLVKDQTRACPLPLTKTCGLIDQILKVHTERQRVQRFSQSPC